jgi:MFS family permease
MKLARTIATMARISIPRWRVFGAACLAHILHDGYSSMLYLLLPSWQMELALSLTQVGILKSIYSAAMAIGQLPASRVGERWSERLPLVAGTFLTASAVVALYWAATPLALGLLLAIGGLGASVQHPLASTIISRVYGGSALRSKLGTYNFTGDLGKMAIPALLTVLIAAFGWRSATLSIGAVGLATAAILLIALPPRAHGPAHVGQQQTPRRPPLAEPVRELGACQSLSSKALFSPRAGTEAPRLRGRSTETTSPHHRASTTFFAASQNVRFWHKADIPLRSADVRFWG